ncbi:DUF6153 family protein [Streptomyces sp. NBC_00239]|uniref:DUF6153 family protein n=1 Tax=Streptomyces sp. NBC_00239 TaxID=2903640 RepID=UPI003FA70B2C
MVTKPTVAALPATRSRVPQLSRLLWLGALLLGLLYTHGVDSGSAAAHRSSGVVATVPTSATGWSTADECHDGSHESPHTVEACAAGQPTSGFDVSAPAVSPLGATLPNHQATSSLAGSTVAVQPGGPSGAPAILRV